MDTSKEYIEMCEKAEEIQKEWKPKRGDFYTVVVHGKATNIINIYIDGFPCLPQRFIPLSELYIWLPRQDQLQEMVKEINPMKFGEGMVGHIWGGPPETLDYYRSMETWEQLWLAFVMREKYNKTWNGKEWVKDEL